MILQPGAAAGIDTWVYGAGLNGNYGVDVGFDVGCRNVSTARTARGYLKFDLSTIPTNAVVDSAVLTLRCITNWADTEYDIHLHKMLKAFFEGIRNGSAPLETDGTTLQYRNHNTTGLVAWGNSVSGGESGTDYDATATTSTPVTVIDADYTWTLTSDVAAMVADPASNHGWLLRTLNENTLDQRKRFASSDHATPAFRPKLTVNYSLGGGGSGATRGRHGRQSKRIGLYRGSP